MKVRHKVTGAVYDNVRIVNGEWYIAENMSPIHAALRVTDCDVIAPADEWRDVTQACEVYTYGAGQNDGDYYISHKGTIPHKDSYRLRKVQVYDYPMGINSNQVRERWAFVVERRTEP